MMAAGSGRPLPLAGLVRLRPHALHSVWPQRHLGVFVAPHTRQCGRKEPGNRRLRGGCQLASCEGSAFALALGFGFGVLFGFGFGFGFG